jgi:hypothetical protein
MAALARGKSGRKTRSGEGSGEIAWCIHYLKVTLQVLSFAFIMGLHPNLTELLKC